MMSTTKVVTEMQSKSGHTDSGQMLTGAAAIAAILSNSGIRTIFAYPGTSEIPLCEAVSIREEMSLINSRGDKEAAFLAAGGNLGTSNVCAAILHGARGLTNALGAVAEVRRDEIAALYIVGMPSRASAPYLPPHGEPELLTAAGAFAKAAYDCSTAETAKEFIDLITSAVRAVTTFPQGPVLLGVPQDLLSVAFVNLDLLSRDGEVLDEAQEGSLESVAKLISQAKNPVILVDDYLFRSGPAAERELGRLSNLTHSPVFQLAYRRGPMLFQQLCNDKVPNYVGQYHPTHSEHFRALQSADLLITVEDRNMYPRVLGPLPVCQKIAITSNAAATCKNLYVTADDVLLQGDVASILFQITESLKKLEYMAEPRVSVIRPHRQRTCDSAKELVTAIANGLSSLTQPIVIDDSQMFGGLIANNYDLLPPGLRVFGSHGGFVGSGLPIAVGLAAANRDVTVMCMLGDQGFSNSIQALAVAGEQQVPIVILVCNNGCSVSLRKQANHEGLEFATHGFLSNNANMSYAAVANGFGIASSVFRWPTVSATKQDVIQAASSLKASILEAVSANKPYLLELVVPSDSSFWEGVWSVEGLEGLSQKTTRKQYAEVR